MMTEGNDYWLRVSVWRVLRDGELRSREAFRLTGVEDLRVRVLTSYGMCVAGVRWAIELCADGNRLVLNVGGLRGDHCYGVEVSGVVAGRRWRVIEPGVLRVSRYNKDSDVSWLPFEGVRGGDYDLVFQYVRSADVSEWCPSGDDGGSGGGSAGPGEAGGDYCFEVLTPEETHEVFNEVFNP